MYLISIFLLVLILFIAQMQFKLLTPSTHKLRILEYHSVSSNGNENQIIISKEKFKQQLDILKREGYQTLWFSDLEKYKNKLPPKSVILTFDDGFLDNYTTVFPILKEYNFKATCFVVFGKIGKHMEWGGEFADNTEKMMSAKQLKAIGSHFELGYHSFKHDNYELLALEEIGKDIEKCKEVIEQEELQVYPVLAYTYGGYYRKKHKQQHAFFKVLKKNGIQIALRIGNRINYYPFKNIFEIQRIDIRGYESMEVFKKKLKYGRKKIF